MSIFGMSGRCRAALALVSACAAGLSTAYAGGHGEKIEFSEPSTPVMASNLTANLSPAVNRLNPTPSGFKQVEEDLFGPLKNSMQPVDSMQGVMTLPMGPQQQQPRQVLSKRNKELMEQRRNWAFTDLNDLYPDPTMEEAFGIKQFNTDGTEKEPVSLIQRYYDRHDQKPAQNRNLRPGEKDAANSWDARQGYYGANGSNPNNALLTGAEPVRKNPFAPDSDDSDNSDKSVATFRASDAPRSPEDALAAQKHRDEFSRLLDPSLPTLKTTSKLFGDAGGTGLNPQSAKSDPLHDSNAQAAQQAHRNFGNPGTGFVDPTAAALHSHVYDDPTATALNLPTLPKPVTVPTPPKTAESVQKMLDPFAAGLGKPKF
jgi:hypothetical protein